jgi:3-oxoacyl-[acyl-carrier protein] reductase
LTEFAGRTALVTGGGRGIGRAVCVELARLGANVAINYRRDQDAAEETAAEVRAAGREAVTMRTDMGDPAEVESMVAVAREKLGPITLLVNNAAYTHLLSHDQLTFHRWQRFMSTNLNGPFLTTWAAKDDMAAAGGGAVVNISSLGGIRGRPDMIGYGTSKAALNHFTRTAGMALAPLGIRVNAVAAGVIATPRADTLDAETRESVTRDIPMGREGTPEEIASAVRFLLSAESSYITGEVLVVAGGSQ